MSLNRQVGYQRETEHQRGSLTWFSRCENHQDMIQKEQQSILDGCGGWEGLAMGALNARPVVGHMEPFTISEQRRVWLELHCRKNLMWVCEWIDQFQLWNFCLMKCRYSCFSPAIVSVIKRIQPCSAMPFLSCYPLFNYSHNSFMFTVDCTESLGAMQGFYMQRHQQL